MPKLSLREDFKKLEELCNSMSPVAKLIDIPTNDLMKYQQGVFLLLNNFSLVDSMYLTKSVRRGFVIKKYVINGLALTGIGTGLWGDALLLKQILKKSK